MDKSQIERLLRHVEELGNEISLEDTRKRLQKLLVVPDQRLPSDTRIFWIRALLALPVLRNKFKQILDLAEISADRLYPGFVCEKLYYAASSKKLGSFVDDLFELGSVSVKLGYKPESILYWLRVVVESKKILNKDIKKIILLGKTAQQRKLKPEFIYYELWGFTNYALLTTENVSSIIEIIQCSMEKGLDPYDIMHWLRINLEICIREKSNVNEILEETLSKIKYSEEAVSYLAEKGLSYLNENQKVLTEFANDIVNIHIPKEQ